MAHASHGGASIPHRLGIDIVLMLVVALLSAAFAPQAARAHTYQILYAFKGGTDGSGPATNMAKDASGNLYGATVAGGGSTNCSGGCGTVFKLDANGTESALYSFTGEADGQYPLGVIRDAAGNIYGTTIWGGNPNCQGWGSCGVVYKLDPAGKLTVLHTFEGSSDGVNPEAALVMDSSGNLYGTTVAGGAGGGCIEQNPPGCGTVFKVDKNGNETVLYSFGGKDGSNPSAGLLLDAAGNLFGSTLEGGSSNSGTIFKLSKDGVETVLHNFTGQSPDNGHPYDGLAADSAGNLYGTTEGHPEGSNIYGTVFKLSHKTGAMTELFTFDLCDGGYPVAGLVRDPKGNLYGTTLSGGRDRNGLCVGGGTTFEVDKSGTETTLENFGGRKTGSAPQSILVRDQAGSLYGTASGGPHGAGVVYKITP